MPVPALIPRSLVALACCFSVELSNCQIPAAGDRFEWGAFRFEVMDMDGLRIDKVMITPIGPNNHRPR